MLDLLTAVLAVTLPLPHDPGLSSVEVRCTVERTVVVASFAHADFVAASALDRDHDGRLDAAELRVVEERFAAGDTGMAVLLGEGGVTASASTLSCRIAENDDIELTFTFAPSPATALHVDLLRRMSHGHRCYACLVADDGAIVTDALLSPRARELPLTGPPGAPTGFDQAAGFLVLGIEHILLGFDHLAFLLALLLVNRSFRRVVGTITAFSLAHSLTLVGATIGLVALPSLLVEIAIAASIVFVAAANLRRPDADVHRWQHALAFGLLHGFGFAGVLADLPLAKAGAIVPLAAFNLGVEIGQLAFAAVAVPVLRRLTAGTNGPRFVSIASVAVMLAGVFWLLERSFG